MAAAIKLNPREADYFKTLAAFNKAKNQADSKRHFEKLIAIKNMNLEKLKPQQYEYYQKWYHAAIFSLLDYYDFKDDYKALASQLNPPIMAKEAKESIELLEKLHLIKKGSDGKYTHQHQTVTSGGNWRNVAIQCYQEETMKLAINSLLKHSEKIRDISTLTMTISKEDMKALREMMSDFRKNAIKLVSESESADSVYQLNLQLFPMTKTKWGIA